jgi:peptide/nickel transport system ATP-binding protein
VSAALLEIHRLEKRWPSPAGEVHALRGVSFALRAGETLALVGESGSGKSTLARCALRIDAPSAGRVFFDGQDITELSAGGLRPLRRQMQMVFQDASGALDPRMRVRAIVEEPLEIFGIGAAARRAQAKELLARVGLPEALGEERPGALSGGQRQRVGIARALALSPRLVCLDEPVSALDRSVQAQVMNLLLELQEERGLAYLLVAHDLGLVAHAASRVAVMYLGKVVEHGAAERVLAAPRHPYTRALLQSAAAPGEPPSPLAPPRGCSFQPRCAEAFRFGDRCERLAPPLYQLGGGGEAQHVACFAVEPEANATPSPDVLLPPVR